jgi:uncharacterized protein with ParB-like and HNH nuclease domain
MPSELQNLDTVFNSRVFRIPDYQRGYSWQTQQVTDFWEDLDRLGGQRNHYTGQLTLEKVPDTSWKAWDEDTWLIEGRGYKPFYVVDGQQRLTTAIILVKCLLERVPEDGQVAFTERRDHFKKYLVLQTAQVSRGYIFGYERDNPSYEYLKTQILGEQSNQYQGTETTYTANLWAAQEFFRKKLKDASPENIERWFKALTQRFLFNVYELQEEFDVFIVFETMNNRGKPLSRLELLKNRLIYLSTLTPEEPNDEDRQALRRNVNDAWKTIFEFLGREKNSLLDDDDFLRAHWIIYFEYSRDEAGQFAKFLLGEWFTADRVTSGALGIEALQRYATSMQESVKKWHAIHFPDRAPGALQEDVRIRLERLNRLGRGAFGPMLMAAMQKKNHEDQIALIDLLDAAERFVFTIGRLCRLRADTGDSDYYRLAGELFRNEKTTAQAATVVQERTQGHFSADKARAEMRELLYNNDGFYSWKGLRYFLFEYEQHLKMSAGMGASKLNWQEFNNAKKDHVTIEHIFPVTPTVGDWPEFELLSSFEQAKLRNSLGNLLPLSQSRNSNASNRPFAKKKQYNSGVKGYFTGSYSEIAVAQFDNWTPETVLLRGLTMVDFIETRWNISLGTRADKVKLLNLEFLEPAPQDPSDSQSI